MIKCWADELCLSFGDIYLSRKGLYIRSRCVLYCMYSTYVGRKAPGLGRLGPHPDAWGVKLGGVKLATYM